MRPQRWSGYPWAIILVEHRTDYMDALEAVAVKPDIAPLTKLLAALLAEETAVFDNLG